MVEKIGCNQYLILSRWNFVMSLSEFRLRRGQYVVPTNDLWLLTVGVI